MDFRAVSAESARGCRQSKPCRTINIKKPLASNRGIRWIVALSKTIKIKHRKPSRKCYKGVFFWQSKRLFREHYRIFPTFFLPQRRLKVYCASSCYDAVDNVRSETASSNIVAKNRLNMFNITLVQGHLSALNPYSNCFQPFLSFPLSVILLYSFPLMSRFFPGAGLSVYFNLGSDRIASCPSGVR